MRRTSYAMSTTPHVDGFGVGSWVTFRYFALFRPDNHSLQESAPRECQVRVPSGGHGDDAENARADPFAHGLDDTTFAGVISLALHPFLKLDELNVQVAQLLFVFLAL